MTVEEVREKLDEIQRLADDSILSGDASEKTHKLEDNLYLSVLNAISNGCKNHQELAAEALKANEIIYEKWWA